MTTSLLMLGLATVLGAPLLALLLVVAWDYRVPRRRKAPEPPAPPRVPSLPVRQRLRTAVALVRKGRL